MKFIHFIKEGYPSHEGINFMANSDTLIRITMKYKNRGIYFRIRGVRIWKHHWPKLVLFNYYPKLEG